MMRLPAIIRPQCRRHQQFGGFVRPAIYKNAAVGRCVTTALIRHNSTATATATATTKISTNDSIVDTLEQGHISVGPDEELLFINSRTTLPRQLFAIQVVLESLLTTDN